MVVAESLGRNEERDALPLRSYAPSGKVFQKALDLAGIKRNSLTITNVLRCKSEAPHPQAAIDHCRQYLDAAIEERKPTLLLALGDVPLKELSLVLGGITSLRGYVLPSRYGLPLISTFHPSHLAREPTKYAQLFGVLLHDLRIAYKFAREGVPPKVETHYILEPTEADKRNYLDRLCSNNDLAIAHDIETEEILGIKGPKDWREKKIIQVQFSSGIGEAIVVSFPSDREFVQAVYAMPNMKWGWNSRLSDRLALQGAGITINGEDHDLMNAHLHLQPNFASGKDVSDNEDKGVPAKLANLQSCVSFYYPQEGPYKGMVQAAVKEAATQCKWICAQADSEPTEGELLAYIKDDPTVLQTLRWYGARDSDLTYRVGCKLFESLKRLGLW